MEPFDRLYASPYSFSIVVWPYLVSFPK